MIRILHEDKNTIFELQNLGDTRYFGEKIAAALQPGIVLLLEGTLGAGKTTLVRELCRALGWKRTCSPSFSLVNEYARAEIPIAHADLYRIERADPRDFGFDEYLDDGWVVIVEWPERLVRADFPEVWLCRIERGTGEVRHIAVHASGNIALGALNNLENSLK